MLNDPGRTWRQLPHIMVAFCSLLAALLAVANSAWTQSPGKIDEQDSVIFKGAFMANIFQDIGIADARAAAKIWAEAAAARRGITAMARTEVYEDIRSLRNALKENPVDLAALRTEDYLALQQDGLLDPFFIGIHNGKATERFVILVHRASGITNLSALRGRKMLVMTGPRVGMAEVWLETALLENQLSPQVNYFS
jgi:hypothetical protein